MDTALLNGEFDLDQRGMPYLITGLSELMQRTSISLKIKRASFIYSRKLGSELDKVKDIEDALHSRAEMLAREAIVDIPQTKISNLTASICDNGKTKISLDISINDETGTVEVII